MIQITRMPSDTLDGCAAMGDEMSSHRTIRMTRATAEQVIGGVGVRSGAATALTGLLRSLAPVPDPDRELSGEADALAALRAARRAGSSGAAATAGRSKRRLALSAVLTVKAAVITAVALVGGVAVAAGAGVLPTAMNVISPNPSHSAPASRDQQPRRVSCRLDRPVAGRFTWAGADHLAGRGQPGEQPMPQLPEARGHGSRKGTGELGISNARRCRRWHRHGPGVLRRANLGVPQHRRTSA